MCGIAGFLSNENKYSEKTLGEFVRCHHHRGPDSSGTYYKAGTGLSHNRLSILDVSSNGNQPFHSADGRYVIVYNGEVYNFRELQKKLGISLRSQTDTEVILELFARKGKELVHELRGMFAFAIYDKQKDELWLFRDRFGIKPLYYYQSKDSFIFSSEFHTLAGSEELKGKLTVRADAAAEFLHLGFIPGNNTVLNEIKQFPAGHYGCVYRNQPLQLTKYWKAADFTGNEKPGYSEARKKIRELLFSSVEEHLISDVPLGLFLSGGVDSSLLAAIASKIYPGRLKTFTVGMKGKKNEAPFARRIADFLHTDHYEILLDENKAIELLDKSPDIYSELLADTSVIPTLLVSELASKHVKVVLSGEGADELFLGYNTHTWANRLNHPLLQKAAPILTLLRLFKERRLRKFVRFTERIKSPALASEIYSSDHLLYTIEEYKNISHSYYKGFSFTKSDNLLKDQILFELEIALTNGLLVKIDRATMHYGIEARVPFLDHRLAEYVLSLDTAYKLHPAKKILKDILYEMVPEDYFRREKWGFGISSEGQLSAYISEKVKIKNKANSLSQLFALFMLEKNRFLL